VQGSGGVEEWSGRGRGGGRASIGTSRGQWWCLFSTRIETWVLVVIEERAQQPFGEPCLGLEGRERAGVRREGGGGTDDFEEEAKGEEVKEEEEHSAEERGVGKEIHPVPGQRGEMWRRREREDSRDASWEREYRQRDFLDVKFVSFRREDDLHDLSGHSSTVPLAVVVHHLDFHHVMLRHQTQHEPGQLHHKFDPRERGGGEGHPHHTSTVAKHITRTVDESKINHALTHTAITVWLGEVDFEGEAILWLCMKETLTGSATIMAPSGSSEAVAGLATSIEILPLVLWGGESERGGWMRGKQRAIIHVKGLLDEVNREEEFVENEVDNIGEEEGRQEEEEEFKERIDHREEWFSETEEERDEQTVEVVQEGGASFIQSINEIGEPSLEGLIHKRKCFEGLRRSIHFHPFYSWSRLRHNQKSQSLIGQPSNTPHTPEPKDNISFVKEDCKRNALLDLLSLCTASCWISSSSCRQSTISWRVRLKIGNNCCCVHVAFVCPMAKRNFLLTSGSSIGPPHTPHGKDDETASITSDATYTSEVGWAQRLGYVKCHCLWLIVE
jgi:hypothetical protein